MRKRRKRKNHVNRHINREEILMRRCLGHVDLQLRACAIEDFGLSRHYTKNEEEELLH